MTRDQAIEIMSRMNGDAIVRDSDSFQKRWCAEWIDLFVNLGMLKLEVDDFNQLSDVGKFYSMEPK